MVRRRVRGRRNWDVRPGALGEPSPALWLGSWPHEIRINSGCIAGRGVISTSMIASATRPAAAARCPVPGSPRVNLWWAACDPDPPPRSALIEKAGGGDTRTDRHMDGRMSRLIEDDGVTSSLAGIDLWSSHISSWCGPYVSIRAGLDNCFKNLSF